MIQDIIQNQKIERDNLLSNNKTIERDILPYAQNAIKTNLIKVILGPRRAGKSVFAMHILRNVRFAYFNFDDESFDIQDIEHLDILMRELEIVYGKFTYVLFDEIQNVPKWELFTNRLHRQGFNVVVTGSNSNLLSKELATHLTGRHVPLNILPFTFQEYLQYMHISSSEDINTKDSFSTFLNSGGYPEVVTERVMVKDYLNLLFDSVIYKDVIVRFNVRVSNNIKKLSILLINNVGKEYSSQNLARALELKSNKTVEKYISHLIESYLFFSLQRYSHKSSEIIRAPRKMYVVDNGFIVAKSLSTFDNQSKLLENLVFTELIKKGLEVNYQLFYYKTRNAKEIDFVVKKALDIDQLIQVSYDISNLDTRKREVDALIEAGGELKTKNLIIITYDRDEIIEKDGLTIEVMSFLNWVKKVEMYRVNLR